MTTVLIVSRETLTLNELRLTFELTGARAIGANNVFEAEQIISSAVVDGLLVDREIDDSGGLALCERIRSLYADAAPAMLILDRSYNPAVLASALAAGTAGVVSKSDPLEQVVSRMLALVEARPGARFSLDPEQRPNRDIDPLTGLTNRQYFVRRLQGEWVFACNQSAPMAVVVLSPDRLATLRETGGETAVERMFSSAARVLEGQLRSRDSVSRFDKDTFAVVLSETSIEDAYDRAQALAQALAETQYGTVDEPHCTTFSSGVAAVINSMAASPDELISDSVERLRNEQQAKLAKDSISSAA